MTKTGAEAQIVKGPGDDVVSMDDLESAIGIPDNPKGDKDEPEAEADSPRRTDAPKEQDKKAKPKEEDVEADDEVEVKEAPKAKKSPIDDQKKPYRVKIGENDIDIPPDTALAVPVSGKVQNVPLKELVSNYSGKMNWSAKIQEVATERKKFQTEQKEVNDTITAVYEKATKENDPRGLVYYIAEAMGANPVKVWQDMVMNVANVLKKAGVDVQEEKLKDRFRDDELEYHRASSARQQEQDKRKRDQDALDKRTMKVVEKFGKDENGEYVLSDRRMVETYDKMLKSGEYSKEEITPELLGDFFAQEHAREVAEKLLDDLEVKPENKSRAVELIVETKIKFPEFTNEDLKHVAKEAFGVDTKKLAKSLSKKVQKADRAPEKRQTEPQREPLRFEDLEDL